MRDPIAAILLVTWKRIISLTFSLSPN